jgi:nitric oxide dioxygenase
VVSEIIYTDHGSDFTSKHLEQVEIDLKIKFKLIAINSKYHAFNEHVKNLSSQHNNINFFVCYEKPNEEDKKNKNYNKESHIDLKWIQSVLPTNKANFYFCKPIPFIKATYGDRKQWNVHEENIHSEFFGPSG